MSQKNAIYTVLALFIILGATMFYLWYRESVIASRSAVENALTAVPEQQEVIETETAEQKKEKLVNLMKQVEEERAKSESGQEQKTPEQKKQDLIKLMEQVQKAETAETVETVETVE